MLSLKLHKPESARNIAMAGLNNYLRPLCVFFQNSSNCAFLPSSMRQILDLQHEGWAQVLENVDCQIGRKAA